MIKRLYMSHLQRQRPKNSGNKYFTWQRKGEITMNNTEFTYATFIDTTPEKLWHAITDRDFLQKYWGLLESDWQVGSGLTVYR